jgi:hypothetical protein
MKLETPTSFAHLFGHLHVLSTGEIIYKTETSTVAVRRIRDNSFEYNFRLIDGNWPETNQEFMSILHPEIKFEDVYVMRGPQYAYILARRARS